MRSLEVWVWGLSTALVLTGCEVRLKVEEPTTPVRVSKKDGYVELKLNTIVSKVAVVKTATPQTYTVTEDSEDTTKYVARTEHNCLSATSTLKYLAAYDKLSNTLLNEDEVDIVLDFEPGSLGQAELDLACEKEEAPNV